MSHWIQKLFRSKKDRAKSPQAAPIEESTNDTVPVPKGLTKVMGFNDSVEILKTKPKKSLPALEIVKTGMLEEYLEDGECIPSLLPAPINLEAENAPIRPKGEQDIRKLANSISNSLGHALNQVKTLRNQLESIK